MYRVGLHGLDDVKNNGPESSATELVDTVAPLDIVNVSERGECGGCDETSGGNGLSLNVGEEGRCPFTRSYSIGQL